MKCWLVENTIIQNKQKECIVQQTYGKSILFPGVTGMLLLTTTKLVLGRMTNYPANHVLGGMTDCPATRVLGGITGCPATIMLGGMSDCSVTRVLGGMNDCLAA